MTSSHIVSSLPLPEPVPVACSRVDALRSHGYTCEALRLAVAVVRTLKQAQREAYLWWGSKRDEMLPRCSASRACRSLGPGALESWVGHPLDPITCLFDTLAEASLLPEDLPRFQYHSGKLFKYMFEILLRTILYSYVTECVFKQLNQFTEICKKHQLNQMRITKMHKNQ